MSITGQLPLENTRVAMSPGAWLVTAVLVGSTLAIALLVRWGGRCPACERRTLSFKEIDGVIRVYCTRCDYQE